MKLRVKLKSDTDRGMWDPTDVEIIDEETGRDITEELAVFRIEMVTDIQKSEHYLKLHCHAHFVDTEILSEEDTTIVALQRS